jgi:hypothetical protein
MKITKLVILFNYGKLLSGIFFSFLLIFISYQINSDFMTLLLRIFGILILSNILASIIAAYILYDKSELYELSLLERALDFRKINNIVLIHASFDPLSKIIEEKYYSKNITVCDIYGNRHEHEKGIKFSKKVFPPNPNEIKISTNKLPFENNSQDVILAITAIHEVLSHKERVEFFKESKRILNDNGCIIVSEQFRNLTNFLFFSFGAFHFLSEKQWKKAINEAGLEIVEIKKITIFANMIIIKNVAQQQFGKMAGSVLF